jgi:cytoskeletal protein RodZ
MSILRRTNQGGSVVSFIIVGVILAAGLIGAVYFLKQHSDQMRKDQAIAISDQQKKANEEAAKSESSNKSSTTSSNKSTTGSSNAAPSAPSETASTSQNLPTTGPELVIGEAIGIYLLTVAIASYVSSRRNLKRSL